MSITAATLALTAWMSHRSFGTGPSSRAVPRLARRRIVTIALGLSLLTSVGVGVAQARPTAAVVTTTESPTRSITSAEGSSNGASTAHDYAAREARSKNVENFKGGDSAIVIGSGTLVVILLVVLIIVLI